MVAKERGLTFEEVRAQAELSSDVDYLVDARQRENVRAGNCVLGSRLAIWLLEDADLKVFLTAPEAVRAQRIQEREGGDLQQILQATIKRDAMDHQRFLRLYGIDNNRYERADVVIDTQYYTADKIAENIVHRARKIIASESA